MVRVLASQRLGGRGTWPPFLAQAEVDIRRFRNPPAAIPSAWAASTMRAHASASDLELW